MWCNENNGFIKNIYFNLLCTLAIPFTFTYYEYYLQYAWSLSWRTEKFSNDRGQTFIGACRESNDGHQQDHTVLGQYVPCTSTLRNDLNKWWEHQRQCRWAERSNQRYEKTQLWYQFSYRNCWQKKISNTVNLYVFLNKNHLQITKTNRERKINSTMLGFFKNENFSLINGHMIWIGT